MPQKRKRWNPELVIEAIKRRAMSGQSLGYAVTVAEDEPLTGAARRYFGSWDAAVTAAGYDINEYKYKLRDERVERWDRDRVLREVREYAQSGGNLSAGYVRSHKSKLYSAAVSYLGSWREALEANGINYEEVKLRDEWSPERVIETIRKANNEGADLSDLTVSALRGDLYGAALRHFGSWSAALATAGIDPESMRRKSAWSREKIIELATRAYTEGITVRQLIDAKILEMNTLLRYFSSVQELVTAIGAEDSPSETVVSRLADVMQEKGISAPDLSKRIGKTDMYVRHLMKAKYLPKLRDALLIADALGCDVRDIWKPQN